MKVKRVTLKNPVPPAFNIARGGVDVVSSSLVTAERRMRRLISARGESNRILNRFS